MSLWQLNTSEIDINVCAACALLFHKLQSEGGGFLGYSLYLFHPSAVVGVPTVDVHSCQLHAFRLSDGLSQSESLWFRV